jgi:poly-gamma-glutamate synthesis protein (capsule biosynthesis protein)
MMPTRPITLLAIVPAVFLAAGALTLQVVPPMSGIGGDVGHRPRCPTSVVTSDIAPVPSLADASATPSDDAFPSLYDDEVFLAAERAAKSGPSDRPVTGLIVPHHLLAAPLAADAFRFAAAGDYRRVILLSPDHFGLGETDITVSTRDFLTPFGRLAADRAVADVLLVDSEARAGDFFYREHGIQAVLPFVRRNFPDADVVAVTLRNGTPRAVVDRLAEAMRPLVDDQTLVVASVDFSHYLSAAEASARDTQSEAVVLSGDPSAVWGLGQPDNVDSRPVLYLQMLLQSGRRAVKMAHANSQDFTPAPIAETTSYFTLAFVAE